VSPMHAVKVADDDDRICLHGGQLTTEHGLSNRAAAARERVSCVKLTVHTQASFLGGHNEAYH
jgi:hypothetical protein